MAQANMSAVERIKAAREKSLRLMQMDADGTLDKYLKEGKVQRSTQASEAPMQPQPRQTRPIDTSRLSESAKHIPREILESFATNKIDDSALLDGVFDSQNALSMLDEGVQAKPKAKVTESVQTQPIQQVLTQSVDYPMIRTIVEDVVRKQIGALSKKMLNESKTSDISTITLGKTFKFLAKNGDIYEAKLQKIGNINEQKKNL